MVKEKQSTVATLSSKLFVGSSANNKGNPTKNEISLLKKLFQA